MLQIFCVTILFAVALSSPEPKDILAAEVAQSILTQWYANEESMQGADETAGVTDYDYVEEQVEEQVDKDCGPEVNIYLQKEKGGGYTLETVASGSVSYTRWGRRSCPNTKGTKLVYEGTSAGSSLAEAGSASFLCLPDNPELLKTRPGLQNRRARVYGARYEDHPEDPVAFFPNTYRHIAPCAVCATVGRSTQITIPGKITCPSDWTKEYHGYLASDSFHSGRGARVPICVDIDAEPAPGSTSIVAPSLLYLIETTCDGIKCPPYSNGAELTCVVCTM